ncbi:MAG: hypothetical protein ACM3OC_01200 [Deltaproteobacteria bacterium]
MIQYARAQAGRAAAVAVGEMEVVLSLVRWFIAPLVFYVLLAVFFLPAYRYAINTDATSYITIAQKYARGDLAGAVNGIWQPLYCWLLAVPIRFGLDPLLSAKCVQIFCGGLTLAASALLSLRMSFDDREREVLLFTLVPVVMQVTFFTMTPDLLFAALALFYFAAVLDTGFPDLKGPAFCGLLGGLAFLAKAYALPFFIAHFTLMNVLQAFKWGSWKRPLLSLLCGLGVFASVVAAWSVPLSLKYGRFTVCEAFSFNASASLAGDWPIAVRFRPPVNPTALSVWEDPAYLPMEKMPHLGIRQIVHRAVDRLLENTRNALGMLKRFSPLCLPAILLALALCFRPGTLREEPAIPALLLSGLLMIGGYLPVNIETRYIWSAQILIVFLAFGLISMFSRAAGISERRQNLILLLACFTFIAGPLARIEYEPRKSWEDIRLASETLAAYGVSGRLASDSQWEKSLYLGFFLKGKYYGEEQPGISDEALRRQLNGLGIDYFFVWRPGPVPRFLRSYPCVVRGLSVSDPEEGPQSLRVFRLR